MATEERDEYSEPDQLIDMGPPPDDADWEFDEDEPLSHEQEEAAARVHRVRLLGCNTIALSRGRLWFGA